MKAYLIPGNGEGLKSRDYQAVLDLYKSLGYQPVFVSVTWKYRTINDWLEEVSSKISPNDLRDSLLSGFSFGSMIALGLAAKTNPKELLLFSLSPYFKEDLPFPDEYLKWHGKRRLDSFKKFSMDELADKVHCPTTIFIGDKEIERYPVMDKKSKQANQKIQSSKLVTVKNVGHDVGDPKYVQAIKQELKSRYSPLNT